MDGSIAVKIATAPRRKRRARTEPSVGRAEVGQSRHAQGTVLQPPVVPLMPHLTRRHGETKGDGGVERSRTEDIRQALEEVKMVGPGQIIRDFHGSITRAFYEFHSLTQDAIEPMNWWVTVGILRQMQARRIAHNETGTTVEVIGIKWDKPDHIRSSARGAEPLFPIDALTNKQKYAAALHIRFRTIRPGEAKESGPPPRRSSAGAARNEPRTIYAGETEYMYFGKVAALKGSILCTTTDENGSLLDPDYLSGECGECASETAGYLIDNGKRYAIVLQDILQKNKPMVYYNASVGMHNRITNRFARGSSTITYVYRDETPATGPALRVWMSSIKIAPDTLDVLTLLSILEPNDDAWSQLVADEASDEDMEAYRIKRANTDKRAIETIMSFAAGRSAAAKRKMRQLLATTSIYRQVNGFTDLRNVVTAVSRKISDINNVDELRSHLGLEIYPQVLSMAELSRNAPLGDTSHQYHLLALMTCRLLEVFAGERLPDDRDWWGNRALTTTGERYEKVFSSVWNRFVTGVEGKLAESKTLSQKSIESALKTHLAESKLTVEFEKIFTVPKGGEDPTKDSFTQIITEDSIISPYAYIRKISPSVPEKSTTFSLRMVQPSQLGFVCYVATPESGKCGLTKYQATGCRISIDADPFIAIHHLTELILEEERLHTEEQKGEEGDAKGDEKEVRGRSAPMEGEARPRAEVEDISDGTAIFVNYMFLGRMNGDRAYRAAVQERRTGRYNRDFEIYYQPKDKMLTIMTTGGRATRPLLVVDEKTGEILIHRNEIIDPETRKTIDPLLAPFDLLLDLGMVEFIGASEQTTWREGDSTVPPLLIAQTVWDFEEKRAAVAALERELEKIRNEEKDTVSAGTARTQLIITTGDQYDKLISERSALGRMRADVMRPDVAMPFKRDYNAKIRVWREKYEALFRGPWWERVLQQRADLARRKDDLVRTIPESLASWRGADRPGRHPVGDDIKAFLAQEDQLKEELLKLADSVQQAEIAAHFEPAETKESKGEGKREGKGEGKGACALARGRREEKEGKERASSHGEGERGEEKEEKEEKGMPNRIAVLEDMLLQARRSAAFTHVEADPALAFSVQAAMTPVPEHSQAPRLTYQAKMSNQFIGVQHTRWLNQFALQMRVAAYGGRPLFETNIASELGLDVAPGGLTVRICWMTMGGWNVEDSVIIDAAFIERGGFHYLQYADYDVILNTSGRTVERFGVMPERRTPEMAHIGANGIAMLGSPLKPCVPIVSVIHTVTTPTGPVSTQMIENVVPGREGVVDRIHFYTTDTGKEAVRVRLAMYADPEGGDKFQVRPAQKATLSVKWPTESMPFAVQQRRVLKRKTRFVPSLHECDEACQHPPMREVVDEKGQIRRFLPRADRPEERLMGRAYPPIEDEETEAKIVPRERPSARARQPKEGKGDTKTEEKALIRTKAKDPRGAGGSESKEEEKEPAELSGAGATEDEYEWRSFEIRPDVILNPHAIPSRMTIGALIEMLTSFAAIELGVKFNATALRPWNEQDMLTMITMITGFQRTGMYWMRSGETGKLLRSQVFIGNAHVLPLKFQSKDKYSVRASGRKNKKTGQALAGRAPKRAGGIQFGEMERDALIGHGATSITQERYCTYADAHKLLTCKQCKSYASIMLDPTTKSYSCNQCSTGAHIKTITIPFGLKRIINKLSVMGVSMGLEIE